jgi:NADP-dependent 3-hydroxy acid dehydrogenase YdfG
VEKSATVTVITGASAGIGAATARALAAQGHALVLAARGADALAALAKELGGAAKVVVADVTRREDVERIRDEALAAFGHVDVWINNAGRGISRPVLQLTDEDLDEMITVNVRSVLYGVQAIVPHFQQRGRGHVINISSFLARVPLAPLRSAYSAAKAAVNSLSANLRMDLAASHPNVHVTTVMPGVVTTGFSSNARASTGPMPPPGGGASPMPPQTAEDVAAVVAQVIAHPVAEIYTNPASPGLARQYFDAIGAFAEL